MVNDLMNECLLTLIQTSWMEQNIEGAGKQ